MGRRRPLTRHGKDVGNGQLSLFCSMCLASALVFINHHFKKRNSLGCYFRHVVGGTQHYNLWVVPTSHVSNVQQMWDLRKVV